MYGTVVNMTNTVNDNFRNRLIIVEGPDKVGKSTFVKSLADTFRLTNTVHILKYSGPTSRDSQEQYDEQRIKFQQSFKTCCELLNNSNNIIIMDRSYVGEFVYSQIYKRLFPYYLDALHKQFALLQPLYIFINGTSILNEANEDDIYLQKHHDSVVDLFEEFFVEFGPHRVIMVRNDHFPTLDERDVYLRRCIINNKIRDPPNNAIYAATYHNPVTSTLNPDVRHPFWNYQQSISLVKRSPIIHPPSLPYFKYALFGEAPGYRGCGYTHIPFYRDASGMLLRNCFMQLGLNLDLMFISNVFHSTPPQNKLYNFITKETLALVNFADIDNSNIPEWVKLEMKLFKADVEFATHYTQTIIAVGRTAYDYLKQLQWQCHLKYTIIFIYHPAYFLYKHMPDQALFKYYHELRKYIVLHNPAVGAFYQKPL